MTLQLMQPEVKAHDWHLILPRAIKCSIYYTILTTKKVAEWKQDDTLYWVIHHEGKQPVIKTSLEQQDYLHQRFWLQWDNNFISLFLLFLLPFTYQKRLNIRKQRLPLHMTAGWCETLCSDPGSWKERVFLNQLKDSGNSKQVAALLAHSNSILTQCPEGGEAQHAT